MARAEPPAARSAASGDRGRRAAPARETSARGWRDVLLRVKREASRDQLGLAAAGVAFYALLALPPALAALVTVYALVADPATVQAQLERVPGLPAEAREVVLGQLRQVAEGSGSAVGLGLAFSLLFALWSASKGAKAVMSALNIVHDENESRGFFRSNLVGLGLTAGAIVVAVLAIATLGGVPAVLRMLPLGPVTQAVVAVLPWLVLAGVALGMIAVVFRVGPDRETARARWVTPGSVAATVLWIGASVGFSLYVANFGKYNETYGSLAGVVVLLLWLWLSGYLVLLGAELDAELEPRSRRDPTARTARPQGRRRAYVADSVGETP